MRLGPPTKFVAVYSGSAASSMYAGPSSVAFSSIVTKIRIGELGQLYTNWCSLEEAVSSLKAGGRYPHLLRSSVPCRKVFQIFLASSYLRAMVCTPSMFTALRA